MKKTKVIVALVLVVVLAMMLVGCNKMPSIRKAFEKEGYVYSEDMKSLMDSVAAEFEEEEIIVTFHYLYKDLTNSVVIIEFKTTEDMEKALADSETLQGMLKDAQKSEYVNGNCVCVPFTLLPATADAILEIFKNA